MNTYMKFLILVFGLLSAGASYGSSKSSVGSKNPTRKSKISVTKETAQPLKLNEKQSRVVDEIREAALEFGIPEKVLVGICKTESNFDHTAFVYNDGGDPTHPNHAIGTCQVLLKTAKEYADFSLKGCERDFRANKLSRTEKSCKLFSPRQNARVAAMYLQRQLKRYPRKEHAIAAYNSGSIKMCSESGIAYSKNGQKLYTCEPGKLMNMEYVRRVNKAAAQFVLTQKDSLVVSPLSVDRSLTSNLNPGKSRAGV